VSVFHRQTDRQTDRQTQTHTHIVWYKITPGPKMLNQYGVQISHIRERTSLPAVASLPSAWRDVIPTDVTDVHTEPDYLPVTQFPLLFLFRVHTEVCGITYTKSEEQSSLLQPSTRCRRKISEYKLQQGISTINSYEHTFLEPHANNCTHSEGDKIIHTFTNIRNSFLKILFS
jgi:hypothetical protein